VQRSALPDRYQALVNVAAGCGLRQGEGFGLAVEDVDFLGGVVHVVRQVTLLRPSRPVFAPPKGGKEREVPLPESVAFALAGHLKRHPAARITLPWKTLDGPPVTASLIFTGTMGLPLDRNRFNHRVRRPALRAAGAHTGRDKTWATMTPASRCGRTRRAEPGSGPPWIASAGRRNPRLTARTPPRRVQPSDL
jgi:integrase